MVKPAKNLKCLGIIDVCEGRNLPFVKGVVQGRNVDMLVDSGAMVTLAHHNIICGQNVILRPTNRIITGVTGSPLDVMGVADLEIQLQDEKYLYECIIIRNMEHEFLIGI